MWITMPTRSGDPARRGQRVGSALLGHAEASDTDWVLEAELPDGIHYRCAVVGWSRYPSAARSAAARIVAWCLSPSNRRRATMTVPRSTRACATSSWSRRISASRC